MDTNGWDASECSRVSFRSPWEAIAALLNIFRALVHLNVGNGKRVRFWKDIWLRDSSVEES